MGTDSVRPRYSNTDGEWLLQSSNKGPVKKADRKVRPPGDVRAPGHDHCAEYSSFVDQ